MTPTELLLANGHRWRVVCYRDGNRKRVGRVLYVRADTQAVAEQIARELSGRRSCDATPWNPLADDACSGYVEIAESPAKPAETGTE